MKSYLPAIISILKKYLYITEKGMGGNIRIFEHCGKEQYVARKQSGKMREGIEEEPGTRQPS